MYLKRIGRPKTDKKMIHLFFCQLDYLCTAMQMTISFDWRVIKNEGPSKGQTNKI